jgi:hypothetical protein
MGIISLVLCFYKMMFIKAGLMYDLFIVNLKLQTFTFMHDILLRYSLGVSGSV